MSERLTNLYKQTILSHNKQPMHFGKLPEVTHTLDVYNPLCGDRFTLYFDLREGRIQALSFEGYGCAISKASASILAKHLSGQTLDAARAICLRFVQALQEPAHAIEEEELLALLAAKNFPGREKCATLSWKKTIALLEETITR